MDQFVQKLTQKSSISNSHSDLRVLDQLQQQKNKEQPKPSITLYFSIMGHEISYMHFDESEISALLSQGKF